MAAGWIIDGCTLQSAPWDSVESRTIGRNNIIPLPHFGIGSFWLRLRNCNWVQKAFLLRHYPFFLLYNPSHRDIWILFWCCVFQAHLLSSHPPQLFSHHGRSTSFRAPLGPTLDGLDPDLSGSQPASRCSGSFHSLAIQCFTERFRPAAGIFWVGNAFVWCMVWGAS